MKKILIISPCDLPVPSVKGGAVSQLSTSLIRVNEEKCDYCFDIVSIYDEKVESSIKNLKYTNFIYHRKNKLFTFFDKIINWILKKIKNIDNDKNILWKLYITYKTRKLINKVNYDYIILQNSGYQLNIFNKKLKIKYDDKIYFHLHNDIPDNVTNKKIKGINLLLISDYLIKKINNKELNYKNKFILKNCITTNKFLQNFNDNKKDELRKKLDISLEDKVFIYVGRIVEYKGILKVIEAFNKLNLKNSKLLIIGSTNFALKYQSKFEKIISDICKKNENIIKTGFVRNEDLNLYYQISDIAILPSLWEEPAGLTMLEACCSAIPLITTYVGGIPEYLDKNFVHFVKKDDLLVDSIVNEINKILDDYNQNKTKAIEYKNTIVDKYNEIKYFENFKEIFK